nr:MAG: hypothetical protein DIU62_03075 [Pseudomonadota bacterium]
MSRLSPRTARAWVLCLVLAVACPAVTAAAGTPPPARRPNILLIISDDIGMDVSTGMYPGLIDELVGKYGPGGHEHPRWRDIQGRPASTPNLDALAQQGMRFTQAWANPFCSPTRTSLLTGLFSVRTGVFDYLGHLTQNHHSFVRDLKEKGGYATAVFGKWHIAGLDVYPGMKPREAGFDLFRGNLHGGLDTYWEWNYHVQDESTPPDRWRTEPAPVRSLPGIAPTTYAPVVTTADAIEWITAQERRDPDRPWFVWLAHNLAHITAIQQPNPMVVPPADTLDEPSRREMEACGGTFGSANAGRCTDKMLMRAMTNSMDTLIGRVLEVVDRLDPDTYVIYVGDNGTWMFGANREFIDNMYITRVNRSKGTAYESGVRVPMAVRGPRIPGGSVSDVPVHSVDLFPTILELAGLPAPKTVPGRDPGTTHPLDGVSLLPVLFDGATQVRDPDQGYLLAETINPVRQNMRHVGARNARYKMVCAHDASAGNCEFYDLIADPLEEFPLPGPANCDAFARGALARTSRDWHYCHLQRVIASGSLMELAFVPPAAPNPAPPGRAPRK